MQDYFEEYIRAVEHPLPEMVDYFNKENEYIKKIVNKESTILDVGCGNGRTMKVVNPFVKKIVGIDYDDKMIGAARANLAGIDNCELKCQNFFEMDLKEKFDIVLASYNLLGSSKISTDRRDFLLAMMKKYAKLGGHVLASAWSDTGIEFARKYYPSIGIDITEIKDNDVITNHSNFKRFTKDELNKLASLVSKDFEIIKLSDIFYLLDIKV